MALDIYQQVFTLSMLSNSETTVKGRIGDDNQDKLQNWAIATHHARLKARGLPQWQTVLGPTIWTHPGGKGADNTWFISHNSAAEFEDGVHDTYVLAIAGTATRYDWLSEDFAVTRVVDFAGWMAAGINSPPKEEAFLSVKDDKKAYISTGTAQGMFVILGTKAPPGTAAPGVGKTIVEFIATIPPTARLILTGHSLGSALSSGIACALKTCGNLARLEKTLVFPTAGPSPGNALFAQFFAQSFPITPKPTSGPVYKAWNSNLWNTLDIVPHAWSTKDPEQQLDKIINIWPMEGGALSFVNTMVQIAKKWVALSRVKYTPLQGYSFNGGSPPVATAKTKADVVTNAKEEHIGAYAAFFGLSTSRLEESWQLDSFGLQKKTEEEIVEDQPFLELLRAVSDDPAQEDYAGGEATAES